jgi:hypothetical protein
MPDQVLIGEVKYTDHEEYALECLRELLEYMAFLHEDVQTYYAKQEILLKTPILKRLFDDMFCRYRHYKKTIIFSSWRSKKSNQVKLPQLIWNGILI